MAHTGDRNFAGGFADGSSEKIENSPERPTGSAVPFEFDVHAVIYAEDAPALESEFHELFSQRRVNKVNERKEFFDVSIDEIEAVVLRKNAAIEVIKEPEAREYRETLAMAASSQRRPENAASDRSSDR